MVAAKQKAKTTRATQAPAKSAPAPTRPRRPDRTARSPKPAATNRAVGAVGHHAGGGGGAARADAVNRLQSTVGNARVGRMLADGRSPNGVAPSTPVAGTAQGGNGTASAPPAGTGGAASATSRQPMSGAEATSTSGGTESAAHAPDGRGAPAAANAPKGSAASPAARDAPATTPPAESPSAAQATKAAPPGPESTSHEKDTDKASPTSTAGEGRAAAGGASPAAATAGAGPAPMPAAGASPAPGGAGATSPGPGATPGGTPIDSGAAGAAVGSSAGRFAAAFLSAPASHIATGYGAMGAQLAGRFRADRKDIVDGAPPIRAAIGGGAADGAVAPEAGAGDLSPEAKAPVDGAPAKPGGKTAEYTAPVHVYRPPSGSAGSAAHIPANLPHPGSVYRPTQDTDLGATEDDLGHATGSVGDRAALVSDEIAAHPGGERVQPASADVEGRIALPEDDLQPKTVASVEMEDYAALDLSPAARAGADRRVAPRLDKSLAGTRAQITAATDKGERDRADALAKTREEADALSADAEAKQQGIVDGARGDIEAHKQAGLDEARGEVAGFEKDAGEHQRKTLDEANQRIDTDQKHADDEIASANKRSADEKKKAQEKEAAERREAERKKKKRSWWQKIGDFFSSIVKALTKAVNAIIDAATKLITGILDAAKKLVNGLISVLAKAIKSMIAAFGKVLKGLVDNLIGKVFPGIAAKLNKAIDATVDLANQAVDAVAEGLQSSVNWLVDKATKYVEVAATVAKAAVAAASALAVGLIKGDFLEALKEAFLAACETVGLPGQELLDMLERAGKLIWEIIKHPATFLKNLLKSLWGGFKLFVADIIPNFLKGLLGWIFGEVATTGLVLPSKFDLDGILSIVLQVVGLTLANVRARAVDVLGEKNVEFAEGVLKFIGILFAKGPGALFQQIVVALKALPDLLVESAAAWAERNFGPRGRTVVEGIAADVKALFSGGPAAMWAQMKSQLSSIKDAIIDGIREWVMEKVVAIAIEKLVTMTNPVGGFIQAIIMIYKTVKFFVEKIKQILAVVNRILDSVSIVAQGLIQVAAKAIDKTMIETLPLVIGFMADLIGLGGIGEKVRKIIEKIQEPVNKALVWLFTKIKNAVEALLAKLKSFAGKIKDKVTGKKKAKADGEAAGEDEDTGPDERTPEEKTQALEEAKKEAAAVAKPGMSTDELAGPLADIKAKYRLKSIGFVKAGEGVRLELAINPKAVIDTNGVLVGRGDGAGAKLGFKTDVFFEKVHEWKPKSYTKTLSSGVGMTADPLGPDHPQGSPPRSSTLATMMGELATDPNLANHLKYIKGHLLNDNLGGPGDDPRNLSPFTAKTNKDHLNKIETRVKDWVNTQKLYVFYWISVKNIRFKKGSSPTKNVLSSTIDYEAYRFDTNFKQYGSKYSGSLDNRLGDLTPALDPTTTPGPKTGTLAQESNKIPIELSSGHRDNTTVLTDSMKKRIGSWFGSVRSYLGKQPKIRNIGESRWTTIAGVMKNHPTYDGLLLIEELINALPRNAANSLLDDLDDNMT